MASGDRLRAERKFLEDGADIPELAAEFGVSERTVYRWASAGDWELRRAQFCHTVSETVRESVACDAVAALRRHAEVWESLIERVVELRDETEYVVGGMSGEIVLDESGNPLKRRIVRTGGHLRDLAQALKAATEGHRLALGLADPKAGEQGKQDEGGGVKTYTHVPTDSPDWRQECERGRA